MTRRDFLKASSAAIATAAPFPRGFAKTSGHIDAAWYQRHRRFAELTMSRAAYVEHGHGPAALFIHGYPLNSFQWRGALERLYPYRRCIAPDVMGMGFTETPEDQTISPHTQVKMLAALLDHLHIDTVDIVGNDSGGLVSQLFVAEYPQRARTLLLTNCDVDENNPPPQFVPFIELAKQGAFADKVLIPQLDNKELARSPKGIAQVFTYPEKLSDETIETYFRPLVASELKKSQVNHYAVALGINELVAVRENLRQWKGPARMVWGLKDALFPVKWAEWLNQNLPGAHGVRTIEEANLFFPEEFPDVIAEEARKLWGV